MVVAFGILFGSSFDSSDTQTFSSAPEYAKHLQTNAYTALEHIHLCNELLMCEVTEPRMKIRGLLGGPGSFWSAMMIQHVSVNLNQPFAQICTLLAELLLVSLY